MADKMPLLELRGLRTWFYTDEGVAKAVDAAMATVMRNTWGEAPSSVAMRKAIGATSTVVAVFEMTWLNSDVSTNRLARTTTGPAPPSAPSRPSTMSRIPPVRSRAVAMGKMAAMSTTLSQLIVR